MHAVVRRRAPREGVLAALLVASVAACRPPAPREGTAPVAIGSAAAPQGNGAASTVPVPQLEIGYVPEHDAIARIVAAGRDTTRLTEDLQYLTDVIGPRLTGSEGLRRAVEWATRRFREDALARCAAAHDRAHHATPAGRAATARRAASSVAAIMLDGSAMPRPAMSSAVPWSGDVRGNGSPRVMFTARPKAATLMAVIPTS